MRKLLLGTLIILSFIGLYGEDLQWTVIECDNPGRIYKEEVGYYYADRRLEQKLGKLWTGSKVTPIQFSEGSYNVQFTNGVIAWVSFLNLKETREMKIWEDCNFYAVDLNGEMQTSQVIGQMKAGDIVTLYAVGDQGEYHVRTAKGKRGAVTQNHLGPVVEDQIKEYNRQAEHDFYFKDELDALTLNKADTVLINELGLPHALVKNFNQETWHYPQVEVYFNGLRYNGITFNIKSNVILSNELNGEGSKSFIDKLPFYLSMKKNDKLNFMDKVPDIKLFENVRQHHWIVRVLIRIFQFILILVFFSIARIIAFQIMRLLAIIRPLSNGVVLIFGYLINLVLNYIYFIYLISHVITEDYIFTAVVMLVMLVIGHRRIRNRILYYRCPNCHLMWSAEDKGSDVVGKKHITENKSETRLTGDYTSASGQRVKEYTRYHWKERKTEKQIRDHRQCNNCGYNWDVERTETVDGHV